MIKILDRYILRAFFTNYLIALAVMIGLYVTLDLFVNLDEFTSVQGVTKIQVIAKIVDFYGYNLLLYFAQLAGVILLIAACCTLGRFHRTNELTAVLASGTSLYRVATPVLLAALAMNGLWFVDQEFLIPRFADKLARSHKDVEGRNSFAVWFQPDRDNSLVSASMFHPRMKEMRGMIVLKRDDVGRMTEVIRADQARWDEERSLWHLENGYRMIFEAPSAGGPTSAGSRAPLVEGDEALGSMPVKDYASALTPKELALQQAALWINFLSLPEVEKLQTRFADAGSGEFIKIKHRRLTTVVINMILLCLGIPFFLNRERPSVIVAGGQCLFTCGICYVFAFLCHSVDMSAFVSNPALPAWLPVLLFGPLAVYLLDTVKT